MCEHVCLFEGVADLLILSKNFRPKGFLLRYFRLCYRLIIFLSMLVSHSVVLARFVFKISLIDRTTIFRIFSTRLLFCITSGAKLSFASV